MVRHQGSRLPGRVVRMARLSAVAAMMALSQSASILAKDLPRREAEDKKQQSCAYLGEGYVKLPGSDTCVKIGGRVRTEGAYIAR